MTAQQIGNLILSLIGAGFGIFLGIYAYTEHIKHKIKSEYQKAEQESRFGLRATVYDVDRGYLLSIAIDEQDLSFDQAIQLSDKLRRMPDLQVMQLAAAMKRKRAKKEEDPFSALDSISTSKDVFDPATGETYD